MLNRLRLVLRAMFLRRRLDREMQDEMELHLARAEQRLLARGLSREEARRRQLFGSADPIGRRLVDAENPVGDTAAFEIVGVVDDSKVQPTSSRNGVVYSRRVRWTSGLLIRTQPAGESMLPRIRSLALAEAPNLPLLSVRTMASIEETRRNDQLRAASAAAGSGLLALFLSAIGLYAIISFAVRQRTREIGIRTALGADRSEVVGLFFFRGIRLSLIGLVIGLPLSIAVLQLLARSDGDLSDIIVYAPLLAALIAIGVISVGGLATWDPGPCRRNRRSTSRMARGVSEVMHSDRTYRSAASQCSRRIYSRGAPGRSPCGCSGYEKYAG